MEDWLRGISTKSATALGVMGILLGIFIYSFIIKGALGGGIMGAFIAIGFMLLHKGVTGKTLKQKQEEKQGKGN